MGGVSTANEVRVTILDEKGLTAIGPLMPGEYLALVDVGGASVLVPGIALIRAGGESSLTHDVQLFDGAINILNAETGEAMSGHFINLTPVPPVAGLQLTSANQLQTDAKGSLKLALAPGSYVVSDGPVFLAAMRGSIRGTVITWGPGGSAQTEVLLTPAKFPGFVGSDADK